MVDEFSYLRDKNWPKTVDDPKILEVLNTENANTNAFFTDNSELKEQIFEELKTYVALEDASVPVENHGYFYHREIAEHESYHRYYYTRNGVKQLILDVNALSKGKAFCDVAFTAYSPDNRYFAYCLDDQGNERYKVVVLDIKSQEIVDTHVTSIFPRVEWHKDSSGFFYVPCSENWRAEELYFHKLGSSNDLLLYKESDAVFWLKFYATSSNQYLVVSPETGERNEMIVIDMDDPELTLQMIKKRSDNHISYITHHGDLFYVLINDNGKNFRFITTEVKAPFQTIHEVLAHSYDVCLESLTAHNDFLVLEYKDKGLTKLKKFNYSNLSSEELSIPDTSQEAYALSYIFTNFDDVAIRYSFSSFVTPGAVYEYKDNKHTQRKSVKIKAPLNPDDYTIKRVFAHAEDGTLIPISLFYKKSLYKDNGSNPLYLYGYGSYGISIDPTFRAGAMPLVNRGYVYAIAHVRGGGDLGYYWYQAGKLSNKLNTFKDFIAAAKYLCDAKYTSHGAITACGGSAGGMLMGYIANEAPQLFKSIVMYVPFVDVVNTMLDDSLPLTKTEYEEWGNPNDPEVLKRIKSYSPYDNIKKQAYPHLFITGGVGDPRVGYWEPTKFHQKVKKLRTNDNSLYLKILMGAGHFGDSSRFVQYMEKAEEITFVLKHTI